MIVAEFIGPAPAAGKLGPERLLIVFASGPDSAMLLRQRSIESQAQPGFGERDLRTIEVTGDRVRGASATAASLRHQYGVRPASFRVLLVGKDGHVAVDETRPIDAERLFRTIDAMPMRREEAARR